MIKAVPQWVKQSGGRYEFSDELRVNNGGRWIGYTPGTDLGITLDGVFDARELRDLVAMMEANGDG